jgi:DNA primase
MKISDIKNKINITQFISEFVPVPSSTICCPFHNESTPSFCIRDDTGYAKCFGACNKSWDIYSFYREYVSDSHRDFMDYVRTQYGIESHIVKYGKSQHDIDVLDYHNQLTPDHYQYLYSRGISHNIVKSSKIGYANIGKFAGRICIPIMNNGVIVGITARKYGETYSDAKYILSSTDDGFFKSAILGNHQNGKSSCIVFEGFMDILSYKSQKKRHDNYHPTCIFGCSASKDQVIEMLSYKDIYICLDKSSSGISGSISLGLLLLKSKYNYKDIYNVEFLDSTIKDFNDLCVKYRGDWRLYVDFIPMTEYVTKYFLSNVKETFEISKLINAFSNTRKDFTNDKCYLEIIRMLEDAKNKTRQKSILDI